MTAFGFASNALHGGHPGRVCVDASLVLHVLLPDERDAATDALWTKWIGSGVQIIGPVLLYAEVTSVLRLRVATGRLTDDEGEAAFSAFNRQGIVKLDRDDPISGPGNLPSVTASAGRMTRRI